MARTVRWWLIPILAAGWLVAGGPAHAAARTSPPRTVDDEAGFFTPEARAQANRVIAEIKRTHDKDLLVETRREAPAEYDKIDKNDPKARSQFFRDWALRRARNQEVNGIYVLICKKPPHLEPVVGQHTRASGAFTQANSNELGRILRANMAKKPDQALLDGVG